MLTGLRPRFVAAMVVVSAVTLGVTALALFSPLERQLRQDVLNSMVRAVRADRLAFAPLEGEALVPGSPSLRTIVRSLHRGSGADVVLVGSDGALLETTDRDDEVSPEARAALRTGRVQQGLVGPSGSEDAQVVVPLTIDGSRIAVQLRQPLDAVDRGVLVVRNAFLLAAGAGLVVALLLGSAIATRLVRRLRTLRDTALRVAELGPVAEMRADASPDEVGDLTRAFATMQDRLREQEQSRRSFVATASHELRTPLASLSIILDTLRQELDGPAVDLAAARDGAARAERQAQRLSGLAAELLDLSRMDAGLPIRQEPVHVHEVVRSVVAELEVRLEETGQQAEVQVEDDPWALGDPGSVARIVRILMDNALRHAPDAPVVRVRVLERGDRVTVEVEDGGPGVPTADRERIFERFWRGSSAQAPGFGLGLAIARELARRMGGDLRVADPGGETPGGGATFVLELPGSPEP